MSQDNHHELISNHLLQYANKLEQILFDCAKYDILTRELYDKKIENLAQLSINKGIDIDDIAKEINQEKENEKLKEKIKNNYDKDKDKKDLNEIEINNISNQIFCKDFYNNLCQYLKRKKESLKIINIVNNNKTNYGNNTTNNKYKNFQEQNNIYDSNRKNNIYNNSSSKSMKCLGKKRKNK